MVTYLLCGRLAAITAENFLLFYILLPWEAVDIYVDFLGIFILNPNFSFKPLRFNKLNTRHCISEKHYYLSP